jgi:hypothetical protein
MTHEINTERTSAENQIGHYATRSIFSMGERGEEKSKAIPVPWRNTGLIC